MNRPPYLTEIQREIKNWVKHNFPDTNADEQFLGIVEEVGELAHHRLKVKQQIRKGHAIHMKEIEQQHADCIGDIMIYLLSYCNEVGFDAMRTLEEIWEKVKERDWLLYPKDGLNE